MPTIKIGDEEFPVWQLTEAERTWYWWQVDSFAQELMNPWAELYGKVKDLPANLQEIVFAGARKSLFPLTRRERTNVCCCDRAIDALFKLATGRDLPDDAYDEDVRTLQIYTELVHILGDSYTGAKRQPQMLEGQDGIAFLYEQMKKKKAAKPKKPVNVDELKARMKTEAPEDWPSEADRRMAEAEAAEQAKQAKPEGKTDG